MSFTPFGLDPRLLTAVAAAGFEKPTPIQTDAMPPALAGRDLIACAATGSGKTAAFLLPILQRLLPGPRGKLRALVLTPTRELAAQIDRHRAVLGAETALTGAAIYGGVPMGPQERALRQGIDLLVATPGRLLDHLQYPYTKLDGLEVLVLDEADRMLDMGFLPDVRRILARLPAGLQVLLFSATMPQAVAELARAIQRNAVTIRAERRSLPPKGVAQAAWPVDQELKAPLLLALLRSGDISTALVFTRTKHRANRVAAWLGQRGIAAERIHGNRTQPRRDEALAAFKDGRLRVLVATDVAARGIDIEALPHVVNFDVPAAPDDYIHRVGRTARAEREGHAWTFVSPQEEGDMRAIERAVGRAVPRRHLAGFDYAQRSTEKLEIPIADRIAAIRATKAVERQRAAEKAARRNAPQAEQAARRPAPRAPRGERSPAPPPSAPARRTSRSGAAAGGGTGGSARAHRKPGAGAARQASRPVSRGNGPWWQRRDP